MSDREVQKVLTQLQAAQRRLEARVTRLEAHLAPKPAPVAASVGIQEETRDAAGRPVSDYFAELAVVCFALLGALVMRVATHQGLLGTIAGTVLGLLYSLAVLLSFQLPGRPGRWAGRFQALQLCGLVLAELILLETYHRTTLLSPVAAAGAVAAVSILGTVAGAVSRHRWLAGLSVVSGMAATAALGLFPEALAWRAGTVLILLASGLHLARRERWGALRPLAIFTAWLVLGLGVVFTAHRAAFVGAPAAYSLGAAVAAWLLLAVDHLRNGDTPGTGRAAWLPLAALWLFGLLRMARPGVALPAALAAGLLLPASTMWPPAVRLPRPLKVGWLLAGALPAALALALAGAAGLPAAIYALALVALGHHIAAPIPQAAGHLAGLAAALSALLSCGLLATPSAVSLQLVAALGAGALLLPHYPVALRARVDGARARALLNGLAILVLGGGILVIAGTLRGLLLNALGTDAAYQAASSTTLAVLVCLALLVGTRRQLKPVTAYGLLGLVVLAGKVLLGDLPEQKGWALLACVGALGMSFVVASWCLGRRSSTGPPDGTTTGS